MRIYIGTSGWIYDHWKGLFYPTDLPKARWLDYYAQSFASVEVNATFYRQVSESTFEKWKDKTPEGFLWAVKANRFITHIKRLKNVQEPLRTFLGQAQSLGSKLGPILFQLPPSLAFEEHTVEIFFSLLPEGHRYVIEARNASWTGQDALSALKRHSIAWCISDTAGRFPFLDTVTADFVYIRLHGSHRLYASSYSQEELTIWAQKIRSFGLDAYVYFDNDFMAYAPANALTLKSLLG